MMQMRWIPLGTVLVAGLAVAPWAMGQDILEEELAPLPPEVMEAPAPPTAEEPPDPMETMVQPMPHDVPVTAGQRRVQPVGLEYTDLYYGTVEEPALRPVKGFFRGVRSLFYHMGTSLRDGNEKFPGLGTVEIFRGARRGGAELLSSTYMGMAGSQPRPYDHVGRLNRGIESDWLLQNVADTATAAGVYLGSGVSTQSSLWAAGGTFTAQKVVDHSPIEYARERQEARDRRQEAQDRYLGQRANVNRPAEREGNLLRHARRR